MKKNNVFHSVGALGILLFCVGVFLYQGKVIAASPDPVVIPFSSDVVDTDGDGVNDSADVCPLQGAYADAFPDSAIQVGACRDADGDDLEDNSKDLCPGLYGPIATGGCPVYATPTSAIGGTSSQTELQALLGIMCNSNSSTCPEIKNSQVVRIGDILMMQMKSSNSNGSPYVSLPFQIGE